VKYLFLLFSFISFNLIGKTYKLDGQLGRYNVTVMHICWATSNSSRYLAWTLLFGLDITIEVLTLCQVGKCYTNL